VFGDGPDLQGPLARRLSRIRRRLALWAALDGAVTGAAVATSLAALLAGLGRLRGHAPHAGAVAAVLAAGVLAGAAARGLRRISLTQCARLADRALDDQDRVLSAIWLSGSSSPLAAAAVADALARTARIEPRTVAPARAPAGLRALGIAAVVLAAIALVPSGTRAARLTVPGPRPVPAAPLPAGALDAERLQAAAAIARAERAGDPTVRALAAELDRIVRGLAAGTLDESAALEGLRALEEAARDAESATARDARAAAAAAAALAASAATQQAAEALRNPSGTDGAADALAGAASSHAAETAGALRAASAAVSAASSAAREGDGQPGRRRLNRDGAGSSQGGPQEPGARGDQEARHLERLARDLDETASSCAGGDPSCRARAGSNGRELGDLQRRAGGGPSLRELERASRQLHDRIARGDLQPSEARAARAFAEAASGQAGAGREGSAPSSSAPSRGDGQAMPAPAGGSNDPQAGQGAAAAAAAEGQAATSGAAAGETTEATGGGIGHENGGPALGAREDARSAAGRQEDLSAADGAGPDRARVIVGAAGHGFASRPYARVYTDYRAAVEDALGAGAVPPGQQYLVRRYFDLIRPRPAGRPAKGQAP